MHKSCVELLLLLCAASASAGPLSGPILDEGASAELVDVLQLPATAGSPPLSRIEHLREIPDGSGRLFVNDMRGVLYQIDGNTVSEYLVFSDLIPKLISNNLQMGFVSFAFHPDFSTNGRLYTAHTESLGTGVPNLEPALPIAAIHHAVVMEWEATDPAANSFSGSSRELIRIPSPHAYHNLGEIGFDPGLAPGNPDRGLLYISAGDFGSVVSGDFDQLQRLDTPYGCLLRIDPLGGPFVRDSTTYNYGIPQSNPHANDGDPSTLGEIFAHGFRNPQNFHFDRGGTGTMFLAEIGQSNLEEVNLPTAGGNYGWPEREGNRAIDVVLDPSTVFAIPAGDDSLGYDYPVSQFDHQDGLAIAGGLAVRNSPPSALLGKFLFGDIVTGAIYYSDIHAMLTADDGDPATMAATYQLHVLRNGVETTLRDVVRAELGNPSLNRTDLRFHSDIQGRLFVTTKQDGFIRELIPVPTDLTSTDSPPIDRRKLMNAPNPFNPRTEIMFNLRDASEVRLTIHDSSGRRVRVLIDEALKAGEHRVVWDGRDHTGKEVASGVYPYRLQTGDDINIGKMTLIR